jgi:hypothetical protein
MRIHNETDEKWQMRRIAVDAKIASVPKSDQEEKKRVAMELYAPAVFNSQWFSTWLAGVAASDVLVKVDDGAMPADLLVTRPAYWEWIAASALQRGSVETLSQVRARLPAGIPLDRSIVHFQYERPVWRPYDQWGSRSSSMWETNDPHRGEIAEDIARSGMSESVIEAVRAEEANAVREWMDVTGLTEASLVEIAVGAGTVRPEYEVQVKEAVRKLTLWAKCTETMRARGSIAPRARGGLWAAGVKVGLYSRPE